MNKSRIDEIFDLILENGGDVDVVAKDIMDDLNAALAKWNDKSKEEDAQKLADHFNAFISVHYPKSEVKYTGKMIIDALDFEMNLSKTDNITDLIDGFLDLLDGEKPKPKKKTLEEMIKDKNW